MSTAVTTQPQAPPATANLQNSLIYIPLSRIAPSKTNPRKAFDGPAMDELVSSIKTNGVLQPVLVRALKQAGEYELVAGERRYRAAKTALLPSIPAMVRELTDQQVLEMQIIENLQREDVTALEEASGYQRLFEALQKEQPKEPLQKLVQTIADKIGKSVRYVYQRMKLNELIPELKADLEKGSITASHADFLVRLCPKDQKDIRSNHLYLWNGDNGAVDSKVGFARSVRYIKEQVERGYQLELKKATFPTEDAKLVPAAGACGSCIKNSLNSLHEGADKTKAMCMDRACFSEKRAAFVQIEAGKLKATASKPAMMIVTTAHQMPHRRDKSETKPLLRSEWKTAHPKECPNVQPAMVVDVGALHDEAVGAKLVCANDKCKVHFGAATPSTKSKASDGYSRDEQPQLTAAQKEEQEKRQLEHDRRFAGDRALFIAVVSGVGSLKAVSMAAHELAFGISNDDEQLISELFGWKFKRDSWGAFARFVSEKALSMDAKQQSKLLAALAIANSLENNTTQGGADPVEQLCKPLQLNSKKIRGDAEAEFDKKAAAKKAEHDAKKTAIAGLPKGTCRICKCTKAHACVLKHKPLTTCKWADKSETLCSNPDCLKKAKAAKKVTKKAAGKKGGRK